MTEKTFEKYKMVVDEWFNNGFNGAAAYRSVYPKAKRADDSFSKLQRLPEVEAYINSKQAKTSATLEVTHQEVLHQLKTWADSDITETMSLTAKQIKELPIEIRRLITSYKRTTRKLKNKVVEEVIELKFVSKEKAIDMINRHIGFYEKDNTQRKAEIEIDLSGLSKEDKVKFLEAIRNGNS